jgi:hypothetical protein
MQEVLTWTCDVKKRYSSLFSSSIINSMRFLLSILISPLGFCYQSLAKVGRNLSPSSLSIYPSIFNFFFRFKGSNLLSVFIIQEFKGMFFRFNFSSIISLRVCQYSCPSFVPFFEGRLTFVVFCIALCIQDGEMKVFMADKYKQ